MAIATNGVLRIASVGRTHVGRVRDNNERNYVVNAHGWHLRLQMTHPCQGTQAYSRGCLLGNMDIVDPR